MIERYGGETTVDHVRAKARCSSCGQKTFEFRIVYRGGSYDALMGAANTKMNGEITNLSNRLSKTFVGHLITWQSIIDTLEIRHDSKAAQE